MRNLNYLIFIGFFLMATLLPHLSGSDKPLEFVVFGDCHFNDIDNPDSTILKKIVKEINRKNPDAEFAVNLGDIVVVEKNPVAYDKAIENYLKVIKNLKIPVYHVPGNHDMTNNEQIRKIYENKIAPLYYSVKKNNTLLIFLNSECLDESQIKWLRNQLEKPAKTKIVFIHKPVFPVSPVIPVYSSATDIKIPTQLRKILEEKNVDAVFSGHEHLFYMRKYGKILQVISGGAGAWLLPAPEGGKSMFHYCIVRVEDKKISVEANRINNGDKEKR